ncbi:adhesion G protein-coupled receptor E5 [Heteronotia binoei]|uniref:adhesion G protein-coupled receptor E5 n=1 Tax=Heteronotia binoei TaxID=13085 RepID=UPI002930E0C9|nr:adhesion G protein-coupled receptor E5 [Heteronotia binoei]
MARDGGLLLALRLYITFVLASTPIQSSTESELTNHNKTSSWPEGYEHCSVDSLRCHECIIPGNPEKTVKCVDYDPGENEENEINCYCDINECEKPDRCGRHARCNNTYGSYHCSCIEGFHTSTGKSTFKNANEVTCNDIDECVSNPCGEGAECKNHPGKFWCPCLPGYISYPEVTHGSRTKSSCKPFSCSASSNSNCSDKQTFICNFTAQLDSICSSSLSAQNHRDKEELLKDMLNLLDDRVSSPAPKNESKEERHRRATELMREVESWLRYFAVTRTNKPISIETSRGTELDIEIRTAGNHSQPTALLSQNGTRMELSWDVANRENKTISLIGLLSYQGLGPLLTGARIDGSEWEADQPTHGVILSKVATAFVGHEDTMALNISVNFTFNHMEAAYPPSFSSGKKLEQKRICAFWKPVSGGWSTKGCQLLESNGNSTHCQCSHLTSFAVLMAFYEVEDQELAVITRIGLAVSLIFLFVSILTFLFCRSIQGIRTTIHLHLCLTLFAAHAIFLVGAGNTANKTACAIVAGLLHYFFLSAFCWMFLEGVELYLMVVQVFRIHSLKHWHQILVGYGLPAAIVGIAVTIDHRGYGTKQCWLSMERGFLWSFLAPVCLIILINAIVFVVTIWKLTKKFADINPDMSQLKKQKVLVITAIAQLCILGTTWIFGMFQFSEHSLVMSYIFTILNSLQGFFIFVLHCLLKKQVRNDYCRLLCWHRSGKPQSGDKYTEFNSTGTFSTLRPQKSPRESGM